MPSTMLLLLTLQLLESSYWVFNSWVKLTTHYKEYQIQFLITSFLYLLFNKNRVIFTYV